MKAFHEREGHLKKKDYFRLNRNLHYLFVYCLQADLWRYAGDDK
jgi:hypothetical protein